MEYSDLAAIALALLFSALFSGLEIAFISSDRLQMELQGKQGGLVGGIIRRFQHNPAQFIGTTLIGNTLALVVYGIYMAQILEPVIKNFLPEALSNEGTILVVQTILSTIVVLITAEFIPKSIFLINPNRMLTVLAVPMSAVYFILYPIAFLVVKLSKFIIVNILKRDYSEDKPVYGLTDLNNFIRNLQTTESEKGAVGVDTKIFHNALEFKTVRLRECMIPRTEISAVDIEDSMETLKNEFISSKHSKILVYKESIDDVAGYVHSSEMFKKPDSLRDILTPITIAPETMLANELMINLITERKSMALVVDEFGGTSGIVTLEDIIEEIFGEIQDEHDEEDLVEQKIDDYNFILSARHEIDYLNDKYHWGIPEGEYETLGGLILSINEDLPQQDEVVIISHLKFTIVAMEDIRIDSVRLTIDPDFAPPDQPVA